MDISSGTVWKIDKKILRELTGQHHHLHKVQCIKGQKEDVIILYW